MTASGRRKVSSPEGGDPWYIDHIPGQAPRLVAEHKLELVRKEKRNPKVEWEGMEGWKGEKGAYGKS